MDAEPALPGADGLRFADALPYPSRREPVYGDEVVATSHPLAVQAGMAQFEAAGNAVDAALAAAIALSVVEPTNNGVGGDLFALVWDGAQVHGLNASGWSPAQWTRERFSGHVRMPSEGWDAVTVPGQVAGWAALHARFGRRPFASLFEPALRHATQGFAVSPGVAAKWALHAPRLAGQPGFAAAFLPAGRPPRTGERFALPALAASLRAIAASRGDEFYCGALARRMVAHARAQGAAHTEEDFAAYAPRWDAPLAQPVADCEVLELPPNGQGLAALQALGLLEARRAEWPSTVDEARTLHWWIEATKLALADLYAHVADPAAMRIDPQALLAPEYLRRRAALIDPERARHPRSGLPGGGTVYLAAADRAGCMVSLIQSNYEGFGSGVVVPDTGIALHNRGATFSLEPGHPNCVGPRKRPLHTIIPGMVRRGGRAQMAFGVMGGPIQPQAHVQVVMRMLAYGQNPQAALDAPRWRILPGRGLYLEPHFAPAWRTGLAALGHEIVPVPDATLEFGAGQVVWRLPGGGWGAASDPRRDGHAAAR